MIENLYLVMYINGRYLYKLLYIKHWPVVVLQKTTTSMYNLLKINYTYYNVGTYLCNLCTIVHL